MKKAILLMLAYGMVTFEGYAQNYSPLLNNSSWLLYDAVACCEPPEERYLPPGTVQTLNTLQYTRFEDPFQINGNSAVLLREDLQARKVYKLVNGQDVLLYDFTLMNADTITLPHYNVSSDGLVFDQFILYTATVDTIAVANGIRKRIVLKSNELFCGSQLTQVWIEGVGSVSHPFYPDFNMFNVCSSGGGYSIFTKCSFQNGVYLYGDASCATLSVAENIAVNDVTLFPNPTKDLVQVSLHAQDAVLTVSDILGKEVCRITARNTNQITFSVASLARGLYIVRIAAPNKTILTKKMMVE